MAIDETSTTQGHGSTPKDGLQVLFSPDFLYTKNEEFSEFVSKMPDTHWAKYDLSAVRLGWEAHKLLNK